MLEVTGSAVYPYNVLPTLSWQWLYANSPYYLHHVRENKIIYVPVWTFVYIQSMKKTPNHSFIFVYPLSAVSVYKQCLYIVFWLDKWFHTICNPDVLV